MIPEPFTLERPAVDWKRHEGDGRPKILPPPGVEWRSASGKTRQAGRHYARPSGYAKALEDSHALNAWRLRRALVGIGQRPDYWTAAAALTVDDADRKALDELAKLCIDASGPSASLIGTALHTWTERLDRGEPVGFVPEPYRPLVDAYARITAPLRFEYREVRTVNDEQEVAGTPDAFGFCALPDPDGVVDERRVIDLKSGSIDYPAGMATQLYLYATSDLYDPETGERRPLEVNTRWGLIVHLRSDGSVPPGLHWLDLEHGRWAVEVAREVRRWRAVRRDGILRPALVEERLPAAPAASDELVDITEALAVTSERAVEPPATPAEVEAPERCELSDLLASECACRVHRPDVPAGALDDGDESTDITDDLAAQRDTVPSAVNGRYDETAAPDPIATAILAAPSGRDLELAWRQHRAGWRAEHDELAAARHRELEAQRALERPRAALAAAIATAGAPGELLELWREYGAAGAWTPEHDELASRRYAELAEAVA